MAQSRARMARVLGQSSTRELPAIREQGLGAWIHKRTHRPLEPTAGAADGPRVGWTSCVSHDTWLTDRQTALPAAGSASLVRRWLGRTVCLSCDSCLL